jgi:tetratricopeptide (TPR) repeat protein
LGLGICLGSCLAAAEPFIPASDDEVLERLPEGVSAAQLRRQRAELTEDPDNLRDSLALARGYVDTAATEGDPRYLGYAQSMLAPWWSQPEPPTDVLVLRAAIRQALQDPGPALRDLELALNRDPAHAPAWVARAGIHLALADYPAARRDLASALGKAPPLVVDTLGATLGSLTGTAAESAARLERRLAAAGDAPAEQRQPALAALAEILARLGRPDEARRRFEEALALARRDVRVLAAWADFELEAGRPAVVIERLQPEAAADALLLRLVLAQQARGPQDAADARALAERTQQLAARFEARQRRGETPGRDEARFTLHVLGQPAGALKLAAANWQTRRGPGDARVLLEAALAAQEPAAARPAAEWFTTNRVEDVQLAALVAKLGGGR